MDRLEAITVAAVTACGLSGCASMEAMLEVMAPVAEAYSYAATQQHYGNAHAVSQPAVLSGGSIPQQPVPTGDRRGTGPAESWVPDATRCVRYENYLPPGWGTDGDVRWFKLSNTCGQEVFVSWCHKAGNGVCSSMGYTATLSPGGQTEAWFNKTRSGGIHWVACPRRHAGKNVYLNNSAPNFYCKVHN